MKEAVIVAAMGEVRVQKPVVTFEGRVLDAVEGWESWVKGLWNTGCC